MALKTNLVTFMKKKGLSIKELAEKTCISEPTLKRLRTHTDANPTLDVLMRLSSALDVSVNDLIQTQGTTPIFYQGDKIALDDDTTEFIIVFTRNTFSFKPGSKAIFKKHIPGGSITKYIINQEEQLFEKVSDDKWLFRDEVHNNYSINEGFISAIIMKELYEVNYV